MIAATLELHSAGPVQCLAGHSRDGDSVYVLRKRGEAYELHQVPIGAAEMTLRSFLAADQAESGELVKAILLTADKPIRKPRRRAAKRRARGPSE